MGKAGQKLEAELPPPTPAPRRRMRSSDWSVRGSGAARPLGSGPGTARSQWPGVSAALRPHLCLVSIHAGFPAAPGISGHGYRRFLGAGPPRPRGAASTLAQRRCPRSGHDGGLGGCRLASSAAQEAPAAAAGGHRGAAVDLPDQVLQRDVGERSGMHSHGASMRSPAGQVSRALARLTLVGTLSAAGKVRRGR
ncbi:Hypothetical predicted protein [Marmota monax]|uniref:Uncharacterized protein n=1 Tax=Marmota monax TaxID=9995 RepID=A0A5E4C562_MARMO|nr:Hypothetical predicted protein [Marmota monax]